MSTNPSTADYFSADSAVYGAELNDADLEPLLNAAGQDVEETNDLAGFHAQAFQDTADNSVIVAYEGTVLGWTLYGAGALADDALILAGQLPSNLLSDATSFISQVQESAGGEPIYVSGHSLGGLEAEAVADDLGSSIAGGVTFGAPALPDYYGTTSSGNASGFWDFVDYGDPVGAYAGPGNDGYEHYGNVWPVGSPADSGVAAALDQLISSSPSALGALDAYFTYHQLANYGTDLGLNAATAPASGSSAASPIEVDVSGGSISVNYSFATNSNGNPYPVAVSGVSASLGLSWDGVDLGAGASVDVPVSAQASSAPEYWSSVFSWNAPYVALQGSADVLNFLNGLDQIVSDITGTAQSLVAAGPSAQTVAVAASTVDYLFFPVNFSLSLALAYDVTIAPGAQVIMDQPSVALDALTIDAGGTLWAGANGFTVAHDLSNQGALNVEGGAQNTVSGSFENDGDAEVAGDLNVQTGIFNTGSLTVVSAGSLGGESYLVNGGTLAVYGNLALPATTLNEGGAFEVGEGGSLSASGSVLGGTVEADAGGTVSVDRNGVLDDVTLAEGAGTLQGSSDSFIGYSYGYKAQYSTLQDVTVAQGATYAAPFDNITLLSG
ncbi:MAG: hypothetical protein ABR863_05370, partial [Roseiarcus sp.]